MTLSDYIVKIPCLTKLRIRYHLWRSSEGDYHDCTDHAKDAFYLASKIHDRKWMRVTKSRLETIEY